MTAIEHPEAFQPATSDPAAQSKQAVPMVQSALKQLNSDPQLSHLVQVGLANPPHSWSEWKSGWGAPQADTSSKLLLAWLGDLAWHLAGILLSAALLSLGGPFWYEALKNLIGLRSVIAKRDDSERTDCQTTQVAQAPTP